MSSAGAGAARVTGAPVQALSKPAPPPSHVAAQQLAIAASAGRARPKATQRSVRPEPNPVPSTTSAIDFVEGHGAPSHVQREIRLAPVPGAAPSALTGGSETVMRRTVSGVESRPATNGSAPPSVREELSTSAVLDRVDEMMSQLEERILQELERRGGRFMGYF